MGPHFLCSGPDGALVEFGTLQFGEHRAKAHCHTALLQLGGELAAVIDGKLIHQIEQLLDGEADLGGGVEGNGG